MKSEKKNRLKAEYRAWKEELIFWSTVKPSLRNHNPVDYARLVSEWKETADAIKDAMQLCVNEAKGA